MDNKLLSLKWPTCLRKFILICCTCMFRWAPWDLEHLVCKNIFAYTQQHLRIKPHKITNTVVPDCHNNCFVQQGQNKSALSCQKQSFNRVNTNVQLHQHTCSEYILRIGVLWQSCLHLISTHLCNKYRHLNMTSEVGWITLMPMKVLASYILHDYEDGSSYR